MDENAENRVGRRGRGLALCVFALALPLAALAQFSLPAPPPRAPSEGTAPDPYGRETPRGCFFGFLQSVEKGNDQAAAAYLQIPPSLQGSREAIARKLQVVFDQRLVTRSLDLVSRDPQGSADDGLGPDLEKVEELRTGTGTNTRDVILVREERPGQRPIWLISWDTIRECLRLYDELALPDIDRHMPPVLVRTRIAGMPLWKIGGLVLLLPVFYAVSWLIVSAVLALVRVLRRRSMAPGAHWWAPSAKSPATFLLTLLLHRIAVERLGIPTLYRLFYKFGGIAVLSDSALRVGDMCKIGGQEGEVEDITLWATRLRTRDRTVVSIPNVVMGAQIENLSRRDKYWFHPIVGLVYETTAEQMRQVLGGFRALLIADARVDQANLRVNLLRLGASSLDIEISAYVRAVTQDDFHAVQEELLLRILSVVEAAGTALAFPAQTVYLAGGQPPPQEGKRA